jgi:predicted metal-dependent peptidase
MIMDPAWAAAEAERRISEATATLICNHPFFAMVLLRLIRVVDDSAKTMWTDGTHLGFRPEYVLGLQRDEVIGVLGHEIIHVVSLHPWRQGTRDNRGWNAACDQVANPIVEDAGMVLPAGALPGIRGKAAEELYIAPPPGGGGTSQAPEAGSAQPPHTGGQQPPDGRSGASGSSTPPDTQHPDAGESDDPGGCGEVRTPRRADGSALSKAEHEQQMHNARVMIQQAVNAARRAGKLPAGLERLAEAALQPRVPWREILAQFLDSQARHDFSWTRPNRRCAGTDFILPSLWSPAYGNVVLGADTSSSVSKKQLRDVCTEILGTLEAYAERGQPPELTIGWFDQKVYPQTVQDAAELNPVGGGGTSFRVVFEWVVTLPELPRALVMITDGECEDYGQEPGIPVLWVLTQSNPRFHPPFGEVAFTIDE